MRAFLKYFWGDAGNKAFVVFVFAFVLVFHVGGEIFSDMTWHDIYPMYCIIFAIGLTIVGYSIKKYKRFRDDDAIDKINNTHL